MLKYLLILSITILISGCSFKNKTIKDVEKYSQNPTTYLETNNLKDLNQNGLKEKFLDRYFKVWDIEKLNFSKKEASWQNVYLKKKIYLENSVEATNQWKEQQKINSNFDEFNRVLKKAIITRNCDLKLFPTKNMILYNPKKPGEGYPFDYNQNSRLKLNTPVLISHYSKDKAWAYVQAETILGWVRADNLYIINDSEEKKFRDSEFYVIVDEDYEVFNYNTVFELKIGTFFPKKENSFLLATNSGFKLVKINENKIKKFPLEYNKKNIAKISSEFINELYGWGGINNHRDCSSFTQDFFKPFGIYLQRNSKAQTTMHKYIDLSKLNETEKKIFIRDNAVAFLSLVYLKGHIMLYIGNYEDEPLVMHNVWGVRTKDIFQKSGRNIIGKTVITSLEPGIELFNVDLSKTILQKIQGLVLLNEPK